MTNYKPKLSLLAALLFIAACTPTMADRGNMIEDYQMKTVIPGQSSRSDVLHSLGSPTTQAPFDENTWYYIGQKTEKHGILDPKIVAERVVEVKFAADGKVNSIREVPKEARVDVPISRDKTPTGGTDFTVMQQFLGNLGKFNKADTKNSRAQEGGAPGR